MTDKEKKSKIADILMDFQEEYSNEVVNRPMLASLYAGNILSFIDPLQEEPVSVWHDASEKPIKGKIILVVQDNGFPFVCDVRNDIGYVSLSFDHSNKTKIDGKDKWAYIEDLLNLSNVEKTVKNWKEEPVSEELEEASKEWLRPQLDKSYANYGEAKMMELTRFDGYAMLDAIEFGAKWKKEQMMASGTDVTVHIEAGNYPYIPQIELYDYDKDIPLAKEGDRYKVILIKED